MSRARPRNTGTILTTLLMLLAFGFIAFVVGLNISNSSQPIQQTPTATQQNLAPDQAAKLAEYETCEPLEKELQRVTDELIANWFKHGKAHMDMLENKISKDERNKIWKETLGKLHHLEPIYKRLYAIWAKECGK